MSTWQKSAKLTMPTSTNSNLSQKRASHLPTRSEKRRHSSPMIRSWARRLWTSAQCPAAKADSSWLSASNCRVFKFRSRPIWSITNSGWSGSTPSGFPAPKRRARHAATGHEFVSCISQKTVASRIGSTKSWAKNRGLASDYSLEGKIIISWLFQVQKCWNRSKKVWETQIVKSETARGVGPSQTRAPPNDEQGTKQKMEATESFGASPETQRLDHGADRAGQHDQGTFGACLFSEKATLRKEEWGAHHNHQQWNHDPHHNTWNKQIRFNYSLIILKLIINENWKYHRVTLVYLSEIIKLIIFIETCNFSCSLW